MYALGETGSATSVAIKQELFAMPTSSSNSPSPQGTSPQGTSPQGSVGPSPHVSKAHFMSGENLKVDPVSGGEISHKRHHPYPKHGHHDNRSMSAKPARPHSMYNGLPPELTTSVGHIGRAAEYHNHINHENEPEVGMLCQTPAILNYVYPNYTGMSIPIENVLLFVPLPTIYAHIAHCQLIRSSLHILAQSL